MRVHSHLAGGSAEMYAGRGMMTDRARDLLEDILDLRIGTSLYAYEQ